MPDSTDTGTGTAGAEQADLPAGSGIDPAVSVTDRDLPSHSDPLVAEMSSAFGGPVGAHAQIGRQRYWTPLRVLLLLGVIFLALGWFGKAACLQQVRDGNDHLGLNWSNGSRQYVAMCYTDVVPLYSAERLDQGLFPYKTSWVEDGPDGEPQVRYMEYPVLSGMFQYASMVVTKAWMGIPWTPKALEVVVYFNVVALGAAFAWLVTIWATALVAGRRRIWDLAVVACSPLVIVHAFTNFDTLATAAMAIGMLLWARKRPALAGIALGIGAALKMYPMLLLGPLLVLAWRTGNMRAWVQAFTAAVLTWALVNLPIAVAFPAGWREFFRLNRERGMDPDSIYNVVRSLTPWSGMDVSLLNTVSLIAFALVCVAVAMVAATAPRRPRVASLMFLLLAGFLLVNKVWSPQYSLWLVPLAALALPHTRILLAWMTIDALVWVPRMMYYLGPENKGLPIQWFTTTVAIRDIAVLILCGLVLRTIYRPETDLVRRDGSDDPAGGVLDRAADVREPSSLLRRQHRQPAPVG